MEHNFESNIICPHCGYDMEDCENDYFNSDGEEIECGDCGRGFLLTTNHEVSYSTKRVPCSDDKHEWGMHKKTEIDQKTCDRWNKNGFYGGGHSPHIIWSRACKNCDEEDVISTPLGTPCPFVDNGKTAHAALGAKE